MSRPTLNLIGDRYGRLLVVGQAETLRYSRWRCRCDCGAIVVVSAQLLRQRDGTRSCGCLRREILQKNGQAFAALMGARRRPAEPDGGRTLAEVWT
jgi:hypothetical protein